MEGEAGFNVFASDGFVELAVRPRNDGKPTRVSVSLDGELVGEEVVEAPEHWFRYPASGASLVYVEIVSEDTESKAPVRALIVVPK
jgi:hypothetical protein